MRWWNCLIITYSSKKVEKCFSDACLLKRKVDPSWVQTIARQLKAFAAADNFGDFNQYLGYREYEELWKEQT